MFCTTIQIRMLDIYMSRDKRYSLCCKVDNLNNIIIGKNVKHSLLKKMYVLHISFPRFAILDCITQDFQEGLHPMLIHFPILLCQAN